ncbi:MATE family efflux transporter [Vibrio sp. qd031]|uniref:MATE family efflux transporter n=1 Tax=Vibrio sp. qd031 TaxID=1603038 RepID=UPI001F5B21E8|nr:MATE family efflux transporter [Vibrio sp. qd031]
MISTYYRLSKPIVSLALPIMIQGFLFTLMGFVDALMIGQLGEVAISGLGNSQQLLTFSFLLFAALSTGGSILISQYSGAHQSAKAIQVAGSIIVSAALCGVALGAIVYFYSAELVALLTTDFLKPSDQWSDVPSTASLYLSVVALAIPLMLVSQMVAATFNATGDTRTPVKVAVTFNVVNFVGNYVFIFGLAIPGITEPLFPPMGLRGAAIATLFASAGQCGVLLYLLAKRFGLKAIFTPNTAELKKVITLGYPSTVDGFYWQGARVFYTVLMNAIGAIAFTGYTIVRTFKSLFLLPVGGIGQATAIRIGQLLGAGKYRLAKASAVSAIATGVVVMLIPVVLLIALSDSLLSLYNIQQESHRLARICIWILAVSLFFTAVNSVIPGLLRAGGDAKAVMNITLISFAVVGAPVSFLLGIVLDYGLIGAFIGISLEEVFKSYLFVRRMKQNAWIHTLV